MYLCDELEATTVKPFVIDRPNGLLSNSNRPNGLLKSTRLNNGEKGTSHQIWQRHLISVWIQRANANLALGMRAIATPRIQRSLKELCFNEKQIKFVIYTHAAIAELPNA